MSFRVQSCKQRRKTFVSEIVSLRWQVIDRIEKKCLQFKFSFLRNISKFHNVDLFTLFLSFRFHWPFNSFGLEFPTVHLICPIRAKLEIKSRFLNSGHLWLWKWLSIFTRVPKRHPLGFFSTHCSKWCIAFARPEWTRLFDVQFIPGFRANFDMSWDEWTGSQGKRFLECTEKWLDSGMEAK